jgi:hypothetical protein
MSSEEACVVHGSQDQVVDLQNATTQINPRHQISIIHLFDRFYESLLPTSSNTKTTPHGSEQEQIIVTITDNIMHCIPNLLECGMEKGRPRDQC